MSVFGEGRPIPLSLDCPREGQYQQSLGIYYDLHCGGPMCSDGGWGYWVPQQLRLLGSSSSPCLTHGRKLELLSFILAPGLAHLQSEQQGIQVSGVLGQRYTCGSITDA